MPDLGLQERGAPVKRDTGEASAERADADRGVKPAMASRWPNCHRYISPVAEPAGTVGRLGCQSAHVQAQSPSDEAVTVCLRSASGYRTMQDRFLHFRNVKLARHHAGLSEVRVESMSAPDR